MTVPACRAHCCRPIRCRGPRSPPSLSSFIFYVCKQEPHLWHTIFLCTCISKVCLNICISPPGLPDKSCFYNCSQTKDPKCFYPNSFFFLFLFWFVCWWCANCTCQHLVSCGQLCVIFQFGLWFLYYVWPRERWRSHFINRCPWTNSSSLCLTAF